ncbi:aldehyde dehydrogenase family protein [Rhodococcus sp. NPDC057014]|uniref:aldehyde dehydrogenase family protein n=1 Tax=Rhodococcus sp. NPDC057014 TaxID=3346000 RepID=UPI003642961C
MNTDERGLPLVGPLIGGSYHVDESRCEPLVGPVSEQPVARVCPTSEEDFSKLLESSVEAQCQVAALPVHRRAELLRTAADMLEARAEEFARTITRQTGKVIRDTRREADRGVWTLRLSAAAVESMTVHSPIPDQIPGGEHIRAVVRRVPVGVVAAITPFNAPLNLSLHKLGPALAGGNSLVLKPSPAAPLTSFMLAELMAEAGFPPAAVNVMPGGAQTALALAGDRRIALVTFTGGVAAGEALARQAPLKPVTLELGGNSPNIVHSDADLAQAVQELVVGGFRNAGQSCNSVQRILVHEAVADQFIPTLCAAVAGLTIGDPLDPATDVGPVVNLASGERVERMIQDAVEQGAEVLVGGRREGPVITPTVIRSHGTHCALDADEVFAPVVYVSTYTSLDEAFERANSTDYGLQSAVFTSSLQVAAQATERLVAGTVLVNKSSNFRLDQLPYGGIRDSGIGREGPGYALEEMTSLKLVVVST